MGEKLGGQYRARSDFIMFNNNNLSVHDYDFSLSIILHEGMHRIQYKYSLNPEIYSGGSKGMEMRLEIFRYNTKPQMYFKGYDKNGKIIKKPS